MGRHGQAHHCASLRCALARGCRRERRLKGTAVESASFRVRKKAFLFLSDAHIRLKLDASIAKAKKLGCDVGKLGWVKVDLTGKPPPVNVLKTWIRESYTLMAGV
jgi:hypothetical protein